MHAFRISGVSAVLSLLLALSARTAAGQPDDQSPPADPAVPVGDDAPAPQDRATDAPPPELEGLEPTADVAEPQGPGIEPQAAAEEPPVVTSTVEADPSLVQEAVAEAPVGQPIRYTLERVEVRGNSTRSEVIRRFVPIDPGEQFEVDDPSIEVIRWRLMGTGWFDDVKLSLARGSKRGWVVLVIDVTERNTMVISRVVAGLARVVTSSRSMDDKLRPYAGLGLIERNLFGLGIGVGAAAVVSETQLGVDLRYHDPMLLGTGFSLTGRAFYNDAREFFGRRPLVSISCPQQDVAPGEMPDPCDPDVQSRRAVVVYDRGGFGLGTGHDITGSLRYTLDYLGEAVAVEAKPRAASTVRGDEVVPIDFRIDDGTSFVSSLRLGFIFDRRDDPALPSQGMLASFHARFASGLLGSSYDFARFEGAFRKWMPLSWGHVLSVGIYGGTVVGRAPFFYHFYAADLSDLLPSRALELNLDHRRTHNLLHTSIVEMDKAELAARLDFEYRLPLHRGGGDLRGVDAYAGAGVFLLTQRRDVRVGIQGYEGLERLPIDLTFDLGLSADTTLGLFKVGFSSLIGFLPDLRQDAP